MGGILLNVHFMLFEQIADFKFGRVLSTAVLVILYWVSYRLLKKDYEGDPRVCALVAFLFSLLPSMLLYVYWLANFIPGLLTMLLAAISYGLVSASRTKSGKSWKRYFFGGYGLLFLTFLIYPPTSYYFLVFVAWRALMGQSTPARGPVDKSFLDIFMVGFLSAAYFVVAKIVSNRWLVTLIFNANGQPITKEYVLSVGGSLAEHINVFIDLVVQSFSLWFVGWVPDSLILAVGVIFACICIWLYKRGPVEVRGRILVWCACFFIAAAPMLVASGGFIALRNAIIGAILFLIAIVNLLAYMLQSYRKETLFIPLLCVLAATSFTAAFVRVGVASLNAHEELAFMREKFRGKSAEELSQIVFYAAPLKEPLYPFAMASDFNLLATNAAFIDGFLYGGLKEVGVDYKLSQFEYVGYGDKLKKLRFEKPFVLCMPEAWQKADEGTSLCDLSTK
ncbi:MAG: hypothetical protein EOM37_03100 [Proteobacteria bacterium]|nr:hypothetical protein [Pseudomonadota bacterium]